MNEEVNITPFVDKGVIDLDNDAVRDNINIFLTNVLNKGFLTPYIALERVRKVLANFHINISGTNFLEGERGVRSFEVNQFGQIVGMNDKGEVVSKTDHPCAIYFEYKMNENGLFDIFSEIVTTEELADLMANVADEVDPEDDRSDRLDEAKQPKETPTKKLKYKEFLGPSPSKGNYDGQWKHSEKLNPYHETKQNLKSFKRFAQSEFRKLKKSPANFDEYKTEYTKHQNRINNIIKLLAKIKAKEKVVKLKKTQ